jgi:hypothetical protein
VWSAFLRPTATANVAIVDRRDGNLGFRDADGNTVEGRRRLITHLTL